MDTIEFLRTQAELLALEGFSETAKRSLVAADELERLHTWAGLISLLDEHWPEDLIPTTEDDPTRDEGPRIVSLIRWVDRLQAIIRRSGDVCPCCGCGEAVVCASEGIALCNECAEKDYKIEDESR